MDIGEDDLAAPAVQGNHDGQNAAPNMENNQVIEDTLGEGGGDGRDTGWGG